MSARISTRRSSLNVFACCSTSAPKPIAEILRPADFRQALLHRRDRLAERDLGLGADHDDALLVLAVDLARSELRLNRHHVLDRQRHAAGGVDHHVVDVATLAHDLPAQADDDRIFVAALAELRRHRPRHVRPDRVGDRRGVQAEERRLRPVNLNRELGPRLVAAQAAGRRCQACSAADPAPPGRCGAPASRSSPRISTAMRRRRCPGRPTSGG